MSKQGFNLRNSPVAIHPCGRRATLLKTLVYTDAKGVPHVAWASMETDGGSIPRFFWRAIGPPFASRYLRAYLIHDSLCATARKIGGDEGRKLRLIADKLLREMMGFLGATWAMREAVYRGVRIGAACDKDLRT